MRCKPHPVKHYLLEQNDSVAALCARNGLDYEPVRRALRGQTRPTWELAELVAEDLGLPVSVLFRVDELRRSEVGV